MTQAINEAKSFSGEKGIWTPKFVCPDGTDPTYTNQYTYSHYYRIGNLVYITFFIRTNITNVGSGDTYIDGLPFYPSPDTNRQAIAISAYGALDSKTAFYITNDVPRIRIGLLSGGTQSWVSGYMYLGGSGCYLKA